MSLPIGYFYKDGFYWKVDESGPYSFNGVSTMTLLGGGSSGLGVFTWAALQAAYPNGGGALAALPAGSTVFVSDWNAFFVPNTTKTVWRSTAPVTLAVITADTPGIVNSTSSFQAAYSYAMPLSLVVPGARLEILVRPRRSAGPALPRMEIQISGVAAAIAQTGGTLAAAYHRFKWFADCRVVNVLRFATGGNAVTDNDRGAGSSVALDTATAFSGSNTLDVGFSTWSVVDSTTTSLIEQLSIILFPPAT